MSIEAITWALGQKVDWSSAKFVLVAMANCADADMVCWPSISHLVEATCQDRKTVIENMKRLRGAGFIEATDEHKGRTGQVVVYRLKSPENGTVKESQKRDIPKTAPVPKTDEKSPVFPIEESRFSVETVPKTGPGTVNEPSRETSGNPKKRAVRSQSPACPEDCDGQTWDDWLALRAKKRAPVTATVIAEARRESDKAGVTLSQFLAIWCARGYQGMQADWIKPHERAGPPSAQQGVRRGSPMSDAERDAANAAANAEAKRLLFGGKAREVIDG